MNSKDGNIQLYEEQPIRTAWDEENEEWYFSVVDVVGVLTEQPDARHAAKYWSVLKVRLKKEGNQLTTNCRQLKMTAEDGKKRLTDVANTEQLLRIIQSIPLVINCVSKSICNSRRKWRLIFYIEFCRQLCYNRLNSKSK